MKRIVSLALRPDCGVDRYELVRKAWLNQIQAELTNWMDHLDCG
jgi:hypothetical protein